MSKCVLQFKCEIVPFIRFPTNSICICKSKLEYLWYRKYIVRFASEMTLFMNVLLSMLIFHVFSLSECIHSSNCSALMLDLHTDTHSDIRLNQMGFSSAHFYPNGVRVASCVAPNSFTQLSSWKQKCFCTNTMTRLDKRQLVKKVNLMNWSEFGFHVDFLCNRNCSRKTTPACVCVRLFWSRITKILR